MATTHTKGPSAAYKMVSVEEATAAVLAAIGQPLPAEPVPLGPRLLGRVLAADVVAAAPLPPFPASIKVIKAEGKREREGGERQAVTTRSENQNSPLLPDHPDDPLSYFSILFSCLLSLPPPQDGYALRSSDPPGTYPVAFSVAAGGDPAAKTLPAGAVAYITTGAPLPVGADAVVQVEDTEAVEGGEGGWGCATVVRILKVRA